MSPMNNRLLVPRTPWSPARVEGLALWLDASDSSTLFQDSAATIPAVADGDFVGLWADKSNNNRNAFQTVSAERPALRLNVRNGLPVVRFTKANKNGLKGADASSVVGVPYTMFVVYKNDTATAFITGFNRLSGSNTTEGIRQSAANTLQGIQQNGSTTALATTPVNDDMWHIATFVAKGTNEAMTFDIIADGGPLSSMTTPRARDASALDRLLSIGFAYNLPPTTFVNEFMDGDIAEIIVYDSELSTQTRQLVEGYLAWKWN